MKSRIICVVQRTQSVLTAHIVKLFSVLSLLTTTVTAHQQGSLEYLRGAATAQAARHRSFTAETWVQFRVTLRTINDG